MRFRHAPWAVPALALTLVSCGGGGDGGGPTGNSDDFHPTSNISLSGSVTYKSVNIPAGVTVTATNDLTITVTGDVQVAGTLLAPCHALTLSADGLVLVSGTLSNDCSDQTQHGAQLAVIGKGGYDFEGAHVVGSGNIVIVDGPNLSPVATVVPASVRLPDEPAHVGGPYRCKIVNTTYDPGTPKPKAPVGGVTDGADGYSVIDGCGQLFSGQTGGNLLIQGITVNGSDGLSGSNGTGVALAVGGQGGNAGPIAFISDRDIDIQGTNNFNGGDAGHGGHADATNPAPSGSATALGGHGGGLKPPGGLPPVQIISNQGSITVTATAILNVKLGTAGDGGSATAIAGNGTSGSAPGPGGNAHASGGNGGDSQPAVANAHGAVTVLGAINVTGGPAGDGGDATTQRGNGGANTDAGKAGGPGGGGDFHGGKGGKGVINGVLAAQVAGGSLGFLLPQNSDGGDGGDVHDTGGNAGASGGCTNLGAGDKGAAGGPISGAPGDAGAGANNGVAGRGGISNASNGAVGGAGNPGGAGGDAGSNGTSNPAGTTGSAFTITGSFNPGGLGGGCPGVLLISSPSSQNVSVGGSGSVHADITRVGGFTGALTVTFKDHQGATRASGTIPVGSTSLDLFFSIPQGFPTGTWDWTVTVSGTGINPASRTVSVTVSAQAGIQMVWSNCNDDMPMVYAAYYDGIGTAPWTQLNITTQSGRQSVAFTATQTKVGFVVVTRRPDGLSVKSAGYYMLSTQFKMEADLSCGGTAAAGTNTVTGAINNVQGQGAWLALANSRTSFADNRTSWSLTAVPDGLHDFIYTHQASTDVFDRMQIFPNWPTPGPGPTIDVAQGFALQQASVQMNGTGGRNTFLQGRLLTPTTTAFMQRSSFNAATTRNIYGVPANQLPAGAFNELTTFVQGSSDFEEEIRVLTTWGNQTVTFAAPLADFTVTQIGNNPVRVQASGAVPAGIDELFAKDITQTVGGVAREWQLFYSGAWNDHAASYNWAIPDLASSGYPSAYGFQVGAPLNISMQVFQSNAPNGMFDGVRANGRTYVVVGRTKPPFTPQ